MSLPITFVKHVCQFKWYQTGKWALNIPCHHQFLLHGLVVRARAKFVGLAFLSSSPAPTISQSCQVLSDFSFVISFLHILQQLASKSFMIFWSPSIRKKTCYFGWQWRNSRKKQTKRRLKNLHSLYIVITYRQNHQKRSVICYKSRSQKP